jgi:PKD repeat protein
MFDILAAHCRWSAFVSVLVLLAPVQAMSAQAAGIAADPPVQIAAQRKAVHELNLRQSPRREFEVRTPDAAFIKVHFDYLNLPTGMAVEVFSPDGSEVYRYGNEARDGYTVDKALGQDGQTSFSAMSISGPVAKVRLVGKPRTPWTLAHGVRVSRVLEGYPADLLESLQNQGLLSPTGEKKTCGANDKRPVSCYAASDPTAVDRSRPVARLILARGSNCTAWRVGPGNHLMTNQHCFATQAEVAGAEIWFNYQAPTCAGTTAGTITKVTGMNLVKRGTNLDYVLFSVNNFASIASFGNLGLDPRLPITGEQIFIPQHPGARLKELATVNDLAGGGRCTVAVAVTDGFGIGTDLGYKCDTEGGSSGSPVIARSNNKVIGIHHIGACNTGNNTAVHMSLIWADMQSFFGGVIPVGDNGTTPTNVAPIANFSATTNALVVSFTDSSSDADGTIASRNWNFGDGTTSTATSPSKTYAAAGTYNVSLTVTDNAGATHTKSVAVTVASAATVVALSNGVAKTGLAASAGSSLQFSLVVPAGATNLKFVTSGGTGNADMYVKFGATPTDTVYDCRPMLSANAETCTITTALAGIYYVRLKATAAFATVSLTGSYSTAPTGTLFQNLADYPINDSATVNSPISVSGITGNAPATLSVAVNIVHTYTSDLKVDLVAPDGSLYNIHNRTSGTNIVKTVTINASTEIANGVWNLRVTDSVGGDTGYINSWSMQF